MKKTLIIGASTNPDRYAYKAIQSLVNSGYEVVAEGLRSGNISGIEISTTKIQYENLDTVTLYVGPHNQPAWYDYILSLKPTRVIFNPGTENSDFEELLEQKGVEVVEACTLVMLSIGNY
jgi:predicted CoA-binding protein